MFHEVGVGSVLRYSEDGQQFHVFQVVVSRDGLGFQDLTTSHHIAWWFSDLSALWSALEKESQRWSIVRLASK